MVVANTNREQLWQLLLCLSVFGCFWNAPLLRRIGDDAFKEQAFGYMPTRLRQRQNLVHVSLNKLIQISEFKSLDVLFDFFKQNVPTDTHVYGEEIQNRTHEELRCKRYGLEYTGRKTRRRIFFGSLVADDSWHTILAHATEAYGLYHSVALVESNVTLSGEEGHVRALRFSPGSLNLEVLESGIFGPNTKVTVENYVDRPEERSDYEVWNAVEFSQRELVSNRWKQNGMRQDDIGILADIDEVFTRDFLLAAQTCDVPEFRPNQDCHRPKIMASTLVFEGSPECVTEKRRWYHPDMIIGECIDKIGDSTIHEPGKRAWNGKGPRLEDYGDSPDSYENMPNVSMYPLWKPHEFRGVKGGRWLDPEEDIHYAYHFHNFFDSIAVMRNKYVTYGHDNPEAASIPLGDIHKDVNLTVSCVTERPDRENERYRLEGGFNSIDGPKPILFALSENYRKERQKELREMVLQDEQEFGRSGQEEQDFGRSGAAKKVYVDLGANCGNTYLQRQNKFETEGGWEIYLWEPSPQMHEFFLNDLAKQHPNINILPFAAGVGKNSTIQLYIHQGQEEVKNKDEFRDGGKCDPTSPYNPSGGTSIFSNAKVAGKPVEVKSVDFPTWLEGLALMVGVDQFHFKVDIEGAELAIMEALLSPPSNPDAPICAAEPIEMEFHKEIFQKGTEDYEKHEQFENSFATMFEAKCGRPPTLIKLS